MSRKSSQLLNTYSPIYSSPGPAKTTISITPNVASYKSSNKYKSPNSTPVRSRCLSSNQHKVEENKNLPYFDFMSTEESEHRTHTHQSPAPSSQSRINRIEKIDNLITKFKRDISAHSLKNYESDTGIKKTLQPKIEDKRKLLLEAEKKNRELKKRIKTLEDTAEERIVTENQHLYEYLNSNLESKKLLEEEINALKRINKELDGLHVNLSEDELVHKNKELKAKNSYLLRQLEKQKETTISPADYNSFQEQLRNLENTQEKLISENNQLKKKLYDIKNEEFPELDSKFDMKTYIRDVSNIRKELATIKNLTESILTGKNVSLSLVLGPRSTSGSDEDSITAAIQNVKSELTNMRNLLCDYQNEISSRGCALN